MCTELAKKMTPEHLDASQRIASSQAPSAKTFLTLLFPF